jgi:hypothetical protein
VQLIASLIAIALNATKNYMCLSKIELTMVKHDCKIELTMVKHDCKIELTSVKIELTNVKHDCKIELTSVKIELTNVKHDSDVCMLLNLIHVKKQSVYVQQERYV